MRKSVINSFVRLAVERRKWIYLGWGLIFALSMAVLATSGYIDEEEAQERDFHGFIEKPLSIGPMQHAVDSVLGREKKTEDSAD